MPDARDVVDATSVAGRRAGRREGLRVAAGAGLWAALAAIGLPDRARAQSGAAAAFGAKTLGEALKALEVGAPPDSAALRIDAPEVAENGALVEITLRSALPKTDLLAVLVERNPFPLAALYRLGQGVSAELAMNLKMNESSAIVLVARADGRYYSARRQVAVTLGGCG